MEKHSRNTLIIIIILLLLSAQSVAARFSTIRQTGCIDFVVVVVVVVVVVFHFVQNWMEIGRSLAYSTGCKFGIIFMGIMENWQTL